MKKLSIKQEANMLHTKIKSIIALHYSEVYRDCDKHVDDTTFVRCMLDSLKQNSNDYENNIYPLLAETLIYCFNSSPKKRDIFAFYKNFFMEYYKKYQPMENELRHHIPIFERSFAELERELFES